jgi:sugar lactone lactonase YvrE
MPRSLVPVFFTLFVAVACATPPASQTSRTDIEGSGGGGRLGGGGTKPSASATARPTATPATQRPSQKPGVFDPFAPSAVPSGGPSLAPSPSPSPSPTPTPWYEVTTFVGPLGAARSDANNDGTIDELDSAGLVDKTGDAARLSSPYGIALDAEGNLYVADSNNARIRKVTPEGAVSTVAGTTEGYLDGPVATAQLSLPYGVVVDKKGVIYVAERSNRIRKIANGQVTTLAGTGDAGFKDGPGAEAQFDLPSALALDANDNLYVADLNNHRIRRITPAGVVSTFAGSGNRDPVKRFADGQGIAAGFNSPNGLVFDTSGNLYVADRSNNMIRQIKPDGTVVRYAGSTVSSDQDGPMANAFFKTPHGIGIDGAGRLYIADTGNRLIRQIGTDGEVVTIAGETVPGFRDGKAREARFQEPVSIVSSQNGELLYVVDQKNNRIRKLTYTRYVPPTPSPEPSPSSTPTD